MWRGKIVDFEKDISKCRPHFDAMCEFRGLIFWSGKIQFEWHIRYHLDVNPWSTVYFFLTIVSNRVKMPCREFWMMISFFRRCAIPSSISSDPHCGAASISARFSFVSFFLRYMMMRKLEMGGGGDGSRAATYLRSNDVVTRIEVL